MQNKSDHIISMEYTVVEACAVTFAICDLVEFDFACNTVPVCGEAGGFPHTRAVIRKESYVSVLSPQYCCQDACQISKQCTFSWLKNLIMRSYNNLIVFPWWRHHMETFSALLSLCVGNPPVTGGFPSQRPVTRNFDVYLDLRLNKQLSKQSRRRWF